MVVGADDVARQIADLKERLAALDRQRSQIAADLSALQQLRAASAAQSARRRSDPGWFSVFPPGFWRQDQLSEGSWKVILVILCGRPGWRKMGPKLGPDNYPVKLS
jgi:hypothetical protein